MANNDFLRFAVNGTVEEGDILSQSDYSQDSVRLKGHQEGTARRNVENTVLKQVSLVCRVVMQVVCDKLNIDVSDTMSEEQLTDLIRQAYYADPPYATTQSNGVVQLATMEEVTQGTTNKVVTTTSIKGYSSQIAKNALSNASIADAKAMSAQSTANLKVSKSGDDMSGPLSIFKNNTGIIFKGMNLNIFSNKNYAGVTFDNLDVGGQSLVLDATLSNRLGVYNSTGSLTGFNVGDIYFNGVTSALTLINNARIIADSAVTKANTAQGTAETAQSTANTAQSTADTKVSKSGDTMTGNLTLRSEFDDILYLTKQGTINGNESVSPHISFWYSSDSTQLGNRGYLQFRRNNVDPGDNHLSIYFDDTRGSSYLNIQKNGYVYLAGKSSSTDLYSVDGKTGGTIVSPVYMADNTYVKQTDSSEQRGSASIAFQNDGNNRATFLNSLIYNGVEEFRIFQPDSTLPGYRAFAFNTLGTIAHNNWGSNTINLDFFNRINSIQTVANGALPKTGDGTITGSLTVNGLSSNYFVRLLQNAIQMYHNSGYCSFNFIQTSQGQLNLYINNETPFIFNQDGTINFKDKGSYLPAPIPQTTSGLGQVIKWNSYYQLPGTNSDRWFCFSSEYESCGLIYGGTYVNGIGTAWKID